MERELGFCVSIEECEYAKDFLKEEDCKRPQDCGNFIGIFPVVCCPVLKSEISPFKMGFRVFDYGILVCVMCLLSTISKTQIMGNGKLEGTNFDNATISNLLLRFPRQSNNIRRQIPFSSSFRFPCANSTNFGTGRSVTRPTSVHRLRPGDIDVIGAMGDSLIAGNGALEEWALGTMIEYRGVSWCAGGEGSWREFLTLPNILKEFNRNLTGFSVGTGEFSSPNSQLNVAFPVSADADALTQAKVLVGRIKKNPKINFKEDWKMVTIFFGANDICSGQCYNKVDFSPRMHAKKLMVALDYLQKNLPRTFVNLIPVLDVSVSVRIKRTMMCRFLHTLFCACFHRGGDEMNVITKLTQQYQRAEEELVFSGRYDTKEDFTVVIQPFMKLFNAPQNEAHKYDEVIDISYITYDCFHFSQKGHALAANMLWNNLLEPVGRKNRRKLKYVMETFECPRPEAPFLFTNKNSKRFLETGIQ